MTNRQMQLKQAAQMGINKVARIAYNGDVKPHAFPKPTPVVLTRFGKPYVILQRFSDDVEKLEQLKTGKITWDDFREDMLQKGYEQMMSGETKIKPKDIVGAERVEVEKQRVKVEGAAFMLEAAKYFQGRVYICDHCGHTMLPATPEQETKYLDGKPVTDISPETPKP